MGRPLWLCFVYLICLCPGTSSSRARQRTPSSSTDGGMAFEAQTRKRALQQPPEANVFMNAAAAAVGQILVKDDAKDRQLERSLAKPPHASVDSISQVEESLLRVRQLEVTVERDLQSIVATINKHNTSISAHARFAEMSAMSASGEEREATSSVVGHSSGARLWERMRGHAEHEAVEWPHSHISALAAAAAAADNLSLVVGSQLTTIRTDLSTLMRNLNLTVAQLSEAKAGAADTEMELLRVREVVEEEKAFDRILDGKVSIDYETGQVKRAKHLLPRSDRSVGNATLLSASQTVAAATVRADPAVLHLDTKLLQDTVLLSLATATGGLAASLVRAPHTLGYVIGGMAVGPSGFDLIQKLGYVETVAQFGSIFLLFSHGLMYSELYADAAAAPTAPTPRSSGSSAFTCVTVMCGLLAALARGSGLASTPLESFLVALAVALSSTSTVLTTLSQARLRDTVYGKTVMELMAVQDLFMAPLLAIPTAITEILYKHSGWALIHVLGAYGIATAAAVLLSRRMLPRVLSALSSGAPEIFGLGVVSYAMAMSLLADRFSLSHEAGALFAGLVLIGTPHVKQAAAAVKPLTSLFGGMYLASLGLIMSPTFIAEHLPTIGAHVACVFGLKLGVVGLTMRVLGFSWAAALAAGATLAQISEVSLFMVARAQQLGLLSRGAYLMILATTVVLLAFGPLAVHAARWIDRKDFLAVESEPLTLWQRIFPLSRRGLIGSPASSRPRSFSDGRKEPKVARKQARSAV